MDHNEDGQGVYDRAYKLCSTLRGYMENDDNNPLTLVEVCPDCERHFARCCSDYYLKVDTGKPCHYYQIIFVDGGCPRNGTSTAQAGMGVFYGEDPSEHSLSIPMSEVTNYIDIDSTYLIRTNQAAELLAAILALDHYIKEGHGLAVFEAAMANTRRGIQPDADSDRKRRVLVIASDSQYLVRGMIEWLPNWKRNNFRNSRGQPLANKELFIKLNSLCEILENKYSVDVGFWHIPREYNSVADSFAKKAARKDVPPAAAQRLYAGTDMLY